MPLYFDRTLEDGSRLLVWDIIETEDELMNLTSLPSEEMEDLTFTKNVSRRKEKLAIRALLDIAFEDKVYLSHHDNGRPYLVNNIIEISISHTSRFAALLVSDEESVGVDIEDLTRNFSVVERKALSDREILDLSSKNRNLHLGIYWSAKESVFKRMSQTDVNFAEQIEIKKFTPKDSGVIDAKFCSKDNKTTSLEVYYEIFEEHVITWISGKC